MRAISASSSLAIDQVPVSESGGARDQWLRSEPTAAPTAPPTAAATATIMASWAGLMIEESVLGLFVQSVPPPEVVPLDMFGAP